MPWQILAGIGTVESANDTSNLPGVHSGANFAGAEGPMQFEPATFAAYDTPVPPGGANPPSPYDPVDAVYAAARMLCANGAGSGDPRDAVFAYNHSAAYVDPSLEPRRHLRHGRRRLPPIRPHHHRHPRPRTRRHRRRATPTRSSPTPSAQLGVPYAWGGTTPGVALDCSGLVQLSYRAAGITLPRTTYAQVTYGITVPVTALQPGDLLFFNDGTPLGHVAIYLGNGLMIQAPYTGTVVSISPFTPSLRRTRPTDHRQPLTRRRTNGRVHEQTGRNIQPRHARLGWRAVQNGRHRPPGAVDSDNDNCPSPRARRGLSCHRPQKDRRLRSARELHHKVRISVRSRGFTSG